MLALCFDDGKWHQMLVSSRFRRYYGFIIAETTQAEHIEHLVKPVKTYLEHSFCVCRMLLILDAL
jgi:hypothetical protein